MPSVQELLSRLDGLGVVLYAQDGKLRYSAPPGALDDDLRVRLREKRDELLALLAADAAATAPTRAAVGATSGAVPSTDPFPLTDLQQAYLVGEQELFEDRAPAVFYHEYALDDADPARLEAALRVLRATHGNLRLAVASDGAQRIVPFDDAGPELAQADLSALTELQAEARVHELRAGIAAAMPPLDAGRPLLLRLVRMPTGYRLQLALRLIAFDGVTTQLFFRELARCYTDPAYRPEPPATSYADYVAAITTRRAGARYAQSLGHWHERLERLERLPLAPALPESVARNTTAGKDGAALRRIQRRLDAEQWAAFRSHGARLGIPPGSALFALYVEALQRWSDQEPALLAVLAAHRPAEHPGLARVWGNCSTTVLVECEPGGDAGGSGFADRARSAQRAVFTALKHIDVSGVWVARELRRVRAGDGNPAPVVFTSGLDLVDGADFLLPLPTARLVDSWVSTPQVRLDHQVYEEAGELVWNFDYAAARFPEDLIPDLADYHHARILELAEHPEAWTRREAPLLPAAQTAERERSNATRTDLELAALNAIVHRTAQVRPDATAIASTDRSLTYRELADEATAVASALCAQGVTPGSLVAVHLPPGWQQIASVIGALDAGAAYLPLDIRWPPLRVLDILRHSGCRVVVTDKDGESRLRAANATATADAAINANANADVTTVNAAAAADSAPVPALLRFGTPPPSDASALHTPDPHTPEPPANLDATAYVIYTSGSTGRPKGVVVSHRQASNTLRDLAARLPLRADDKVIALSSISFDLSVFDIFGTLAEGGTVVVAQPSPTPDPALWARAVQEHGVTVWNSVPALMEMTLEHLRQDAPRTLASLRLIMLSGDWVAPTLLDRLQAVCPSARVLVLGGATEAAIWSNWFEAREHRPADWTTVPYGYPLANQSLHVLDQGLADTPTWVPGDLYLGGEGVADGYLNDAERTAAAFLVHPRTGERLYRTGDRGRYRPGGVVEFLGRRDFQVKVGGFRIELGEIEARLVACDGVHAAVAAVDRGHGEAILAAFVVADDSAAPDPGKLHAQIAEHLPPYMVPAVIKVVERFPLSGNGKVDRDALTRQLDPAQRTSAAAVPTPPRTPAEARLCELWSDVFGRPVRSVTEDFFAGGGNSLLGVRLLHRIDEAFGYRPPLSSLFANRTVEAQARMLGDDADADSGADSSAAHGHGLLVPILGGQRDRRLFLIHPIGGDVLCYRELADALDEQSHASLAVLGLRAAGLLPGEQPSASIEVMASAYADDVASAAEAGPIHLAGWSMGGTLALETARVLAARGWQIGALVLLDSFTGRPGTPTGTEHRIAAFFTDLAGGVPCPPISPLRDADPGTTRRRLVETQRDLVRRGVFADELAGAELARLFAVYDHHCDALESHIPATTTVRPLLVRAIRTPDDHFTGLRPIATALAAPHAPAPHNPTLNASALSTLALSTSALNIVTLDESHFSIVTGAGARAAAAIIERAITEAEQDAARQAEQHVTQSEE